MRPFRFLHTADLHLGSPFQGLQTRLPERWSTRVRQAADEVFARIVKIAIAERVDFVTIAGDVFDSLQVPMRAWFELRRGLQRLDEAGIRVFMSHGNHDPRAGEAPILWPENVHVFPAVPSVPTGQPLPSAWVDLAADTHVQVCGFCYSQAAMTASYANAFVRDSSADFAIGLYHGSVGAVASADHANYCPTSVRELGERGFDVFALGHIHQAMVLSEARPLIFYPGVPQGRHIREPGRHGVVIVDVDERGRLSYQWRETAALTWASVDVSLDEEVDLGRVPRRVTQAVRACVEGEPAVPAIVRVWLTGVTPLAVALQSDTDLKDALMEELHLLGLPVWIERVDTELVPPLERDALVESTEFIGELLRLIDACRADPARARALLEPVLETVFHSGSGMSLDGAGDGRFITLLDAAERQLLTWYAAAAQVGEEASV